MKRIFSKPLFLSVLSFNLCFSSCNDWAIKHPEAKDDDTPNNIYEEYNKDEEKEISNEENNGDENNFYTPLKILTDSDTYVIHKGDSKNIIVTYSGGYKCIDYKFKYKCVDDSILSVNNEGIITGKEVGNTKVIIYYDVDNNSIFNPTLDVYTSVDVIVESDIFLLNQHKISFYNFYGLLSESKENSEYKVPKDVYESVDIDAYKISLEGDIPYISLNALQNLLIYKLRLYNYSLDEVGVVEKEESRWKFTPFINTYTIDNSNRSIPLYFDIENNSIYCEDFSVFSTSVGIGPGFNNNIPNDISIGCTNIKESKETKNIINPSPVTIDLNRYNINLYEIDEVAYIPLHLGLFFLQDYSNSYYYDGTSIVDIRNIPDEYYTFFCSGGGRFSIKIPNVSNKTRYFTFTKSKNNEDLYTFAYKKNSSSYLNGKAEFNPETGKVTFNVGYNSKPNVYSFTTTVVKNIQYDYQKENDNIILINADQSLKAIIREEETLSCINTFGINMKKFNYNFLVLNLDNCYGLKKDMGVEYFDDYFKSVETELTFYTSYEKKKDTIFNHIMRAEYIEDYETVLNYIINVLLGDCHTGVNTSSIMAGVDYFKRNRNDVYSSRLKSINNYLSKYKKARNKATGEATLTFEDKTAVIQFDNFWEESTLNSEVKEEFLEEVSTFEEEGKTPQEIYKIFVGRKWIFRAVYYAFLEIKKRDIQNVVFDMTTNGGGAAFLLTSIQAFLTSDPINYFKDTLTNQITEYHYNVDMNLDGLYDENDTYQGQYKFFVLQSEGSFSCANAFSTSCKNNSIAYIIGAEYSGGGACSVFYNFDTFGTTFQISSRYSIMLKNDNTFINNDKGVKADKVLNSDYWYDYNYLNNWLNENFNAS